MAGLGPSRLVVLAKAGAVPTTTSTIVINRTKVRLDIFLKRFSCSLFVVLDWRLVSGLTARKWLHRHQNRGCFSLYLTSQAIVLLDMS